VRLSTRAETLKEIREGKLALISPVITSTEGRWRGQDQMDADSASHLGQACDRFSTSFEEIIIRSASSVDDDDDVVQRRERPVAVASVAAAFGLEDVVVLLDIAHALGRERTDPSLHLGHGPLEHVAGDLRVGDHGREQVRHLLVDAQLQTFGVDEQQAHLGREWI